MKQLSGISNNANLFILILLVVCSGCLSCSYNRIKSKQLTENNSVNASNQSLINNSENFWAEKNDNKENVVNKNEIMNDKIVSAIKPLGFTWETNNPFLFCVHHLDNYPAGNDDMGPSVSLEGRNLGEDFVLKDGWRMYHGEKIPGFPAHPHRGFETVTVVLKGLVDHSDSHGEAGRYGNGDVQWMTAGSGLQHSEMFPLLNKDEPNPLELFQIWVNLPKAKKFCTPYFAMFLADKIPVYTDHDQRGNSTEVTVIAGRLNNVVAPEPAPDSWAADPANEVGIWLIKMQPNAIWNIPHASAGVYRTIYFYKGSEIRINGVVVPSYNSADILAHADATIENSDEAAYILLLQGKPIDEPVIQRGPFVMNTFEEIEQAYSDYRKTQFGGWPWPRYDNVHSRDKGRFASYKDGRNEIKKE